MLDEWRQTDEIYGRAINPTHDRRNTGEVTFGQLAFADMANSLMTTPSKMVMSIMIL